MGRHWKGYLESIGQRVLAKHTLLTQHIVGSSHTLLKLSLDRLDIEIADGFSFVIENSGMSVVRQGVLVRNSLVETLTAADQTLSHKRPPVQG